MEQCLIYFTVGGDSEYTHLLKLCLKTLFEKHDMSKYDVMVMCDELYRPHVNNHIDNVDIYVVNGLNRDHVHASMRKCEIFKYPKIHQYTKVLYLDCDIICVDNCLNAIMSSITDDNKLYVLEENASFETHNGDCHGFRDYTPEQMMAFERDNIKVFNCGQFAFQVSENMKNHFANVCNLIEERMNSYFYYEQSHMNFYFNTNRLTVPLLNQYFLLPVQACEVNHIGFVHFAYGNVSFQKKLRYMEILYHLSLHQKITSQDMIYPPENHAQRLLNKFNLHRFF